MKVISRMLSFLLSAPLLFACVAEARITGSRMEELTADYTNALEILEQDAKSEVDFKPMASVAAIDLLKKLTNSGEFENCRILDVMSGPSLRVIYQYGFAQVDIAKINMDQQDANVTLEIQQSTGLTERLLGPQIRNSDPINYKTLTIKRFWKYRVGRRILDTLIVFKINYLTLPDGKLQLIRIASDNFEVDKGVFSSALKLQKAASCTARVPALGIVIGG